MLEIPHLTPPSIQFSGQPSDPYSTSLAEWICSYHQGQTVDLCMMGVPLSKSSISFSGAHLHPQHFRKLFSSFSTYNWNEDLDLQELKAVDLGDVSMHHTDIPLCHQRVQEAMFHVQQKFPDALKISVGGDHSITAPLVKGWQEAQQQRIGIIQFDAHLDVRDLQYGGPTNGTPMRNLLSSQTIKGENIFTIGLRDFANSKPYRDYAEGEGIHLFSAKEVHEQGIKRILQEAMDTLEKNCDTVYVTFDIDVIDQSMVPGVPAIGPLGLTADQLLTSAWILGKWPKTKAIDFVCVDPTVDHRDMSTRISLHVFLYFVSGYMLRLKR